MRMIAVSGGKGGTGKSFVATNLAVLLSEHLDLVLADLDVEAPNDHILLGVERLENEEPIAIYFPIIDYKRCTACGACAKVCDTGAIVMAPGRPPFIMPRLCSGCKACLMVCPYDAISPEGRRVLGYTYKTIVSKWGRPFTLLTGVIREGEEHTPPAITIAKKRAIAEARGRDLLIVDTGAGTGNGISIALQGARLLIAVTEPTPMGLHDLRAILEIAQGMGIRVWLVINRHGIGPEDEHLKLAREYGVEQIFRIPFDTAAARAYARGAPVVRYDPKSPASRALHELAEELLPALKSL